MDAKFFIFNKLINIIADGLETAFSMGYYPIKFKPNQKFAVEGKSFYIGYDEMLKSHRYSIHAMTGEQYDANDPEVVSYQNMKELLIDGWEPQLNTFPQRSEAKAEWLKWMKSVNPSDFVITFIENSPDNVWIDDENFAQLPQWMFIDGGSIADALKNMV